MVKSSSSAASAATNPREHGRDADSSSEESSSVSLSTSNPSTTHHTQQSDSTKVSLTHNETKAVNRSKILVYLMLFVAAATVGAATYLLSHRQEVNDFQAAFYAYSKDIAGGANSNAESIFGIIHSLSTALTAYSRGDLVSWPNVTLPNFDRRATEAEGLTGVKLLAYAPIVMDDQIRAWEEYSWDKQDWIVDDWSVRQEDVDAGPISRSLYYDGPEAIAAESLHCPLWQTGPVPYDASIINMDLYQHETLHDLMRDAIEVRHSLMSGVLNMSFLLDRIVPNFTEDGHPRSVVVDPVYSDFREGSDVSGFILAEIAWETILADMLPTGTNGIVAEVVGSCGETFSYMINGHDAIYQGEGHWHDSGLSETFPFAASTRYDGTSNLSGTHCEFSLKIIATEEFQRTYYTSGPAIFAAVVVLTFLFTACVFALYDWMVFRRQTKLLNTAERTNAIVSSLFPKDVRDRIMAEAEEQARQEQSNPMKGFRQTAKNQLKGFLNEEDEEVSTESIFKTKPIADLFPEVTVMFADLVGFTAWSSMREPAQVFMLLETIYHEFDQIAKRRRVFKVETVGDCYVAVSGLPEPRKDHAVVMARFARDCLYKMHILVRQLEITLGPDTADLGLRFGLHSGPVTAGVLRGERARFQLFGDTMNTTARVETTGAKNRIHISQETADLLSRAGKGHWLRAREDKVHAKGKGELTTFWLEVKGDSARSRSSAASSESGGESGMDQVDENNLQALRTTENNAHHESAQKACAEHSMNDKGMRLVNWNTEIIGKILKEVIARREATNAKVSSDEVLSSLESEILQHDRIVLEECVDVIELPSFCAYSTNQRPTDSIKLEPVVVNQLHDYIQTIAAMYRDNPFHNFEHASHVTMSVTKLLSRIVAPDIELLEQAQSNFDCDKVLHDHTYGITSSPLTQLSIILSALVHDVDHTGVPNSQLVQEQASIAAVYKNKSIAEQNSIDIAWDLLMQDTFKDLRRTIYQTEAEFKRFRQLLVNSVLATDIMDKDLSAKRKERWNLAFSESSQPAESRQELIARKATIVIEHLIQASDVVHTMQHWHIYRKWNERLFLELYKAFTEGQGATDPSANWYQGEIGFFDFYIIPLAKKLKNCGVFGVSSDEYLNYALQNRREWEAKGQEVVAEMKEKAASRYGN